MNPDNPPTLARWIAVALAAIALAWFSPSGSDVDGVAMRTPAAK